MNPDYAQLPSALMPELVLVVGALLVLTFDLTLGRKQTLDARQRVSALLGVLATVVAMWLGLESAGVRGEVFDSVFVLDRLTFATRFGVLGLTALTLLTVSGSARLRNPAEYVAITLFAACGFTLMSAAQQLLVAFLALELASLALYVLAGFDKTRPESAEAGLKYFLFGGISAAFLLFGFSLIYGLTGSIALPEIAIQLQTQGLSPLLVVALVMVLVAFGFKAAAAPFHLWAPDAYQGAPTTSTALIASASKLAGFTLFVRLLWAGFAPVAGEVATPLGTAGWVPIVAVISGFSLLLGNFAALAQTNVRRLFAYSAIAHAGALLLGVIAAGRAGPGPLFYYAATYGIATVGAFGVLAVIERSGACQNISDLAGLHRRSPLLAGCLLVFVLSLAGIPPLAGFFGKFAVFTAALRLGGLDGPAGWLAVLAIGMSAVALYYYLIVLKQALVIRPVGEVDRIKVPFGPMIALLTAAVLLVVLGVFPSLVLRFLR
jgi:NADH-quinone oxidoreductase subunit N